MSVGGDSGCFLGGLDFFDLQRSREDVSFILQVSSAQ